MEYMCVHVKGPGAGRALLGSSLSRWWRGHVPSCLPPPPPPPPPPPFLSFLQGRPRRHRAGCAVQISAFSLPPGSRALQGPCPPGLGPGPAAGSQTDTSSPAAPLGAGPVAAPPWRGGGPRVAAPPTAPPSSRSGPPRAVIG